MANLEIVGENLRCYLYIYVNDKAYCIDKNNASLNIELSQGKHTVILIGTETNNYKLEGTLKSMSFSFRPALLQLYKDRKIINHILGWKNRTAFFIKKLEIDIRENSKITFSVGNYYRYNFFDVKETVKDIEITKNSHVKSLSVQNYNFVNQNQKLKYYIIQAMLLFLKYIINIIFPISFAVDDIAYLFDPIAVNAMSIYYRQSVYTVWFTIIVCFLIFGAFAFRFIFYFVKLIKCICDDSDVLNN